MKETPLDIRDSKIKKQNINLYQYFTAKGKLPKLKDFTQ